MISKEYLNRIRVLEHNDQKKNYNMNVFSYLPEGNINEMEVVLIMSGCIRDALNNLKIWIEAANENHFILLAPEFDRDHYSIAEHEYGNLIHIEYDYSTQDIYTPSMTYGKEIKSEEDWIYSNIDEIYLEFIKSYQLENRGYILFGHSSGSQFAHRFLMFSNSKFCKKYLCANAGLYTFYDASKNYPYGIKNLSDFQERIKMALEKEVYILAGEQDIKSDYLNSLPMDMEEGKTRYERAVNYFRSASYYAEKHNIKMNWKFISMPDVHHNPIEVIPIAVKIIKD